MMFDYILIIFVSVIVPVCGLKIFQKLAILDRPGADVPKRDRVPTAQGLFLILGFLLAVGVSFPEYFTQAFDFSGGIWGFFTNNPFLGLIIGTIILGIVTFIDSFKSVSPKIRLMIQLLIGLIAFFIGGVGVSELVLPGGIELNFPVWLGALLTVIWFVGFINAVNWFDGIYGMASGVSTVGFLTVLLLIKFVVLPAFPGISPENLANLTMVLNLSFVMFCLSFVATVIEFKPFGVMRDIGSMFLGFVLAYLALLGGAKIGTILVALALVIFDAIWVFVNRIYKMKKSPLKGDLSHLHHRLMAMNWSRTEVRVFIWGWSVFLMILMILQGTERLDKLIIFVMMFLIFFGINIYLFWIKKMPMEFKPNGK